jgi:hypothetical protein
MNVAALIVGFGTGMVFTRRMGPLGGAGVLILVLPPALWYSGASLAAAVAGVFIYQVLFLWLPMPAALTLLPTLRAMAEQPGPLAVNHEPEVTDHGRRPAYRPGQPVPVAAPHRALCSAGLRWPGRAREQRRRRSHAQERLLRRLDQAGPAQAGQGNRHQGAAPR